MRQLYLAQSSGFVVVAIIFHSAIIIALSLSGVPLGLQIPIMLFIILHAYNVICLHGLRRHRNSIIIICKDCEKWLYKSNSTQTYLGTLIPKNSYSCGLFIILYIQHFNRSKYIIVPRDSLSTHNYRFLAYYVNI